MTDTSNFQFSDGFLWGTAATARQAVDRQTKQRTPKPGAYWLGIFPELIRMQVKLIVSSKDHLSHRMMINRGCQLIA